MTVQTEIQTEQEEMFPKTPREIADEFLEHFQADVEAAEKAVFNARRKLREANTLRDHAELNLKRAIDAEMNAQQDAAVEEGYMIEAPAEEVEDAEVVEEDGTVHDGDEYDEDDHGNIIGVDPAPGAMVWVAWPGVEESVSLVVGPQTRFGEIVANYLNANPNVDFLAKYVISDANGGIWDPKATIKPEHYGSEFFIDRDKGPSV